MKTGLDYWNVCSHHPDYFRELAAALLAAGHEVHVISAIGRNRSGTIAAEVAALGIPVTAVHEVTFRHPRESPALKTAECLRLDDVCREMTATGKILALRVTRPARGDIAAERPAS